MRFATNSCLFVASRSSKYSTFLTKYFAQLCLKMQKTSFLLLLLVEEEEKYFWFGQWISRRPCPSGRDKERAISSSRRRRLMLGGRRREKNPRRGDFPVVPFFLRRCADSPSPVITCRIVYTVVSAKYLANLANWEMRNVILISS